MHGSRPDLLESARWVLGGLLSLAHRCCDRRDAWPRRKRPARAGSPAKAESAKADTSNAPEAVAAARCPRCRPPADAAARAAQPSAAYQESMRQTVERRRQRRARRQQNAGDATGAVGAIVPWPMPPASIIRHTREVHGEVDSLLYGLTAVRRHCRVGHNAAPLPCPLLAVKLVDLTVRDLRGLDQAAGELLAHRVDVDSPGPLLVFGIGLDDVDVEDEAGFALGGEPVNVVLVV